MFIWVKLPQNVDAQELLAKAIDRHVAFVPGAPFYVNDDFQRNTMRLSFVTVSEERIRQGIAILGQLIREASEN